MIARMYLVWFSVCKPILAKFMLPKRRFWKRLAYDALKNASKTLRLSLFTIYARQTKMPNEDLGTSKNIRPRHFVSTFHTPNYSFWAKSDEKYLQNVLAEYFSTFPNLRLGAIKYHHIGAVLSWHLMYVYKVEMIWMATFLNSFVHTIMYSYYLGCLLKLNQVRVIKKYITSIQLCQFFILYVNLYFYRPPIESWFNYNIIIFFASYGVGVIGLFGRFYYDSYIDKKKL